VRRLSPYLAHTSSANHTPKKLVPWPEQKVAPCRKVKNPLGLKSQCQKPLSDASYSLETRPNVKNDLSKIFSSRKTAKVVLQFANAHVGSRARQLPICPILHRLDRQFERSVLCRGSCPKASAKANCIPSLYSIRLGLFVLPKRPRIRPLAIIANHSSVRSLGGGRGLGGVFGWPGPELDRWGRSPFPGHRLPWIMVHPMDR